MSTTIDRIRTTGRSGDEIMMVGLGVPADPVAGLDRFLRAQVTLYALEAVDEDLAHDEPHDTPVISTAAFGEASRRDIVRTLRLLMADALEESKVARDEFWWSCMFRRRRKAQILELCERWAESRPRPLACQPPCVAAGRGARWLP